MSKLKRKNKKNLHCFSCENEDCLGPPKYKCDQAFACYEFEVKYGNGERNIRRGCLDSEDLVQFTCFTKEHTGRQPGSGSYKGYCCKKDFCNMNLTIPADDDPAPNTSDSENYLDKYIFSVCIGVFVFVIAVLAIICLIWRICKCWRCRCRSFDSESVCSCEEKDPVNNYTDNTDTSGSGLGLPLLMSRTISKEVTLVGRFYKGKSSEVWKGKWLGHNVAIKIFCTRDEHLFKRELEVYKSMTIHDNILEFLAADCASIDSCTQQWLITIYCELGSLYDYLNGYTLEYNQCMNILLGIVRGLDYLHSETIKPGIAHRDIKTKNILMRDCNSVCLADFGLAVTHDKKNGKIVNGEKYKVGTIRYMSPEILSDSFKENDFSSHKMSDIYSLGLVMWEVIRRCENSDGKVDEYSLPYGGIVPNDPSFEDMKKVVCIDEQRPSISVRAATDPVLSRVIAITSECWNAQPSKRLTSLRVKKSLIKIHNQDYLLNSIKSAKLNSQVVHKNTNESSLDKLKIIIID